MRNWGKAPQILVALNCVCFSVAHADDAPAATPTETPATEVQTPAVSPSNTTSTGMNPTVPDRKSVV